MNTIKIFVLVTCFNRKDKTIEGLKSLFYAATQTTEYMIDLSVFLTDDGCTDGTADAVLETFPSFNITIVKSLGNAFWAGGMRLAWRSALASESQPDYYLLYNDDVVVEPLAFNELLCTDKYSLNKYDKPSLCSGLISSLDKSKITYGGKKYRGSIIGRAIDIIPDGEIAECEMTNANLLLISSEVVKKIGILDEGFIHGAADWDYGMMAHKAGFPVLLTANICGRCDFDHDDDSTEKQRLLKMNLRERKAYFASPLRLTSDIKHFMWKHNRLKYFLFVIGRNLNIYLPRLYYLVNMVR